MRVTEIRVVENIEEFRANLEPHSLPNLRSLGDSEVCDVDSGAVEELAVCVAKSAVWATGKRVRWEVGVRSIGTVLAGILRHDVPDKVGYIGVPAANQRVIPALAEPDGQTTGIPRNAVEGPASRQALRQFTECPVEGNCPDVTHHEVVGDVVCRKRAAQPRVQEVHPLAEAGGIVHRLSERVCRQESKIRGLAFYGDLSRRVARIGDVGREAVVLAEGRPQMVTGARYAGAASWRSSGTRGGIRFGWSGYAWR